MTTQEWQRAVRCYAVELPLADVPAVAIRASQSCVWHAVTEYYRARFNPVACSICGGNLPPRQIDAHELCKARQANGLSAPRLDYRMKCPCAKCQRHGLREIAS